VDDEMIIREFRAGRLGLDPASPFGLLLLHHVGARTGQPRTTPVGFVREGDRYLLWATNYGSSKHPSWYHNLKAHPEVTAELPTGSAELVAAELTGDERDAAWERILEHNPGVKDYPAMAGNRRIPILVLSPR
jgi:deazaflavin-dependent oxidoreductase (nitroreductase family)